MNVKQIIIGESYRHKDHPNYTYSKAIKILKPRELPNIYKFAIVKCEYTVNKNDNIGLIRYFRPCDLIKDES